jgi:SagB-type dehydrogenase family enzyme
VINHVEGIPSGIYLYEPEQRLLRLVRAGECHQALQATQAGSWVNVTNLSLGIVPVGNYAAGFAVYGDRWYRIQNMEAGMVAQRLYLAAAASGLGCRASLSYSDAAADALLGLPEGYTSLIQILLSSQDPAAQERGRYELSISW